MIAASILFCFFLIGRNEIVKAFPPIYQSIAQAGEEMISFFFENDEKSSRSAKTAPPDDNSVAIKPDNLVSITIDTGEAEKRITFPLPTLPFQNGFISHLLKYLYNLKMSQRSLLKFRFSYIDNDNKLLRIEI